MNSIHICSRNPFYFFFNRSLLFFACIGVKAAFTPLMLAGLFEPTLSLFEVKSPLENKKNPQKKKKSQDFTRLEVSLKLGIELKF